ncbi:MAG: hypothetical protein JNM43_23225 [Planctomycetaceae bacterium]|nr:hypothetical protein [Planctomycetaceae bacterium]
MIRPESLQYLSVDRFGTDPFVSRLLLSALNCGLIDRLTQTNAVDEKSLFAGLPFDECGRKVMIDTLKLGRVIEGDRGEGARIRLTEEFRGVLPFLELLHVRLRFAELVASDFFTQTDAWLISNDAFMSKSRLFEYFDYRRCLEVTSENCRHAARWMTLTTVLTRYEAPVCCDLLDFGQFHRMLDIGGNSGEFAVQTCQRSPGLIVEVADLPVVCHVGQQHVQSCGMSDRVTFRVFDLAAEPVPEGFDLVTFKSVLHDWPDGVVSDLLERVFAALPPGGTVLIFERMAYDVGRFSVTFSQLPVALFLRSYRHAEFYKRELERIGFAMTSVTEFVLDVPFSLITARKPV